MTAKLAHLDALRGLAAVVVVLAHSVGAFYPHAIFGEPFAPNSTAEMVLRVPPLSLAIASHSAVCLFFILSGYVLSLNFLTRPHRPGQLAQAMLKRPVRLGGLVVFTIVGGYLLMLSGAMISGEAEAAPWLAGFWKSTPDVAHFLCDLLFQPFASGTT
ncbi:MAG: acyltransferase family protein, partial [Aureliella sp.]